MVRSNMEANFFKRRKLMKNLKRERGNEARGN
jgi:hypothetical protein